MPFGANRLTLPCFAMDSKMAIAAIHTSKFRLFTGIKQELQNVKHFLKVVSFLTELCVFHTSGGFQSAVMVSAFMCFRNSKC